MQPLAPDSLQISATRLFLTWAFSYIVDRSSLGNPREPGHMNGRHPS